MIYVLGCAGIYNALGAAKTLSWFDGKLYPSIFGPGCFTQAIENSRRGFPSISLRLGHAKAEKQGNETIISGPSLTEDVRLLDSKMGLHFEALVPDRYAPIFETFTFDCSLSFAGCDGGMSADYSAYYVTNVQYIFEIALGLRGSASQPGTWVHAQRLFASDKS